jgi:hypothetical protein
MLASERDELLARFGIGPLDLERHVYWRITSNWMELKVRFLTRPHGTRDVKDQVSRFIHAEMRKARIAIAPTRLELLGAPTSQPPG